VLALFLRRLLAFRFTSHYANSVTQTVDAVVAAFLIYAILLPEATLKNATVLAGIIALVVMVAVGLEPNAT
jgi:hypothetical protein